MKKLFATLLAVLMVMSATTVAFAETTTLTTTVPPSTYTLNVPKEVAIDFGATSTDIGNFTVTESAGFAVGKNLNVTLTFDPFASEEVSTVIPYSLKAHGNTIHEFSEAYLTGTTLVYLGTDTGSVVEKAECIHVNGQNREKFDAERFTVEIPSTNWGKTLAGDYTSVITFTAEVVVVE